MSFKHSFKNIFLLKDQLQLPSNEQPVNNLRGKSLNELKDILFFGPCIFNNEDKNKPTKCTN